MLSYLAPRTPKRIRGFTCIHTRVPENPEYAPAAFLQIYIHFFQGRTRENDQKGNIFHCLTKHQPNGMYTTKSITEVKVLLWLHFKTIKDVKSLRPVYFFSFSVPCLIYKTVVVFTVSAESFHNRKQIEIMPTVL